MAERRPKIAILGATGMLGSAMARFFAADDRFETVAIARSSSARSLFPADIAAEFVGGVDVLDSDRLTAAIAEVRPDVLINGIGLVKQLASAGEVLSAVPVNSVLPHRLALLCKAVGARLVHVSTDCVFSGSKGNYVESDSPDASDVYGLSKFLGEVDEPHAVTLRTSIIGHELRTSHSLLEWFLSQQGRTKGYTHAIFSGVPTVELARIVRDHVLPFPELRGLYHVSAEPIAKYDLLKLVAAEYGKQIEIVPDDALRIDRSLNSERFRRETGYVPPSWPELVATMRRFG
jgi:dTDP-4-dehydrorhamnose reductase